MSKPYKAVIFLLLSAWSLSQPAIVNAVTVSGLLLDNIGNPLYGLVVANGQYTFTPAETGAFQIDNVPLDSLDRIRVLAASDGFDAYNITLTVGETEDLVINLSPNSSNLLLTVSHIATGLDSKTARVSGTVTYNGSPVCALVIANEEFGFSCSSSTGSYAIDVPMSGDGNIDVYAFAAGFANYRGTVFADLPEPYQLTVNVSGAGFVISSPPGINCPGTCTADFEAESTITLSAYPDPFWTEGSWTWTGACSGSSMCIILMDSGKVVDVTFQCELISIPAPSPPINTQMTWECLDLEAVDGFEVVGPNGHVILRAGNSIKLGPGFSIGPEGVFQGQIDP